MQVVSKKLVSKLRHNIGAGTGPAGPAMAGPFSAVYAFDFCVVSFPDPVSQRIRSPRKSDPGRIRYASDIDPTLADSIRGINGVIGFPLSTSQSKLWCIHADLTYLLYRLLVCKQYLCSEYPLSLT